MDTVIDGLDSYPESVVKAIANAAEYINDEDSIARARQRHRVDRCNMILNELFAISDQITQLVEKAAERPELIATIKWVKRRESKRCP